MRTKICFDEKSDTYFSKSKEEFSAEKIPFYNVKMIQLILHANMVTIWP